MASNQNDVIVIGAGQNLTPSPSPFGVQGRTGSKNVELHINNLKDVA